MGRSGLSIRAQEKVRQLYEQGRYNLLLATSVAEEGLNVRACKLVVMVDAVYSGKSLTQCRGRIRKEGGVFHLLFYNCEQKWLLKSEQQVDDTAAALQQLSIGLKGKAGSDPWSTLNKLRQLGRVRAFDFEEKGHDTTTRDFVYTVKIVRWYASIPHRIQKCKRL